MAKLQLLSYSLILLVVPMVPVAFIPGPVGFILVPITYLCIFPILCGLLSKIYAKGVVPGKFVRELSNPAYKARRFYGFFWGALYYCTPILYFVLTIDFYKKLVLKLFSYSGSTNFTFYPDSWIRDLPILNFGDGVYLANKCTLGSNLVLTTGEILVDRLTFGRKTTIGHLAIVGLGTSIGEESEIGISVAVGLRCSIGDKVRISPTCAINHGASIGSGTQVGAMSYIGVRAQIGENLEIPAGANIPAGAVIKTEEDLQSFISSETSVLVAHRDELMEYLANDSKPAPKRKLAVSSP